MRRVASEADATLRSLSWRSCFSFRHRSLHSIYASAPLHRNVDWNLRPVAHAWAWRGGVRAPERSGTVRITLDDDEPARQCTTRITGGPAPTQVVRFVNGRLLPSDDLVWTDARTESYGIRRWRAFRCHSRKSCLTSDSPQPRSGSRDSASEGIEHPQAGVHGPPSVTKPHAD
jgi:hypothetical protein